MNKKKSVRCNLIWLLVWLAALALSVALLICVKKPVTAGGILSAFVAAAQVVYWAIRLVGTYRAEKRRGT